MTRGLLGLLLAIVESASVPAGDAVHLVNGRLCVDAVSIAAGDVLAEMARQCGPWIKHLVAGTLKASWIWFCGDNCGRLVRICCVTGRRNHSVFIASKRWSAGAQGGLCAIGELEFVEDTGDVVLDGFEREAEGTRDLEPQNRPHHRTAAAQPNIR